MSRPWIKAADIVLAAVIIIGSCIPLFMGGKEASQVEIYRNSELVCTLPLDEDAERGMRGCDEYLRSVLHNVDSKTGKVHAEGWLGGFPPQHTNPAAAGPIPS